MLRCQWTYSGKMATKFTLCGWHWSLTRSVQLSVYSQRIRQLMPLRHPLTSDHRHLIREYDLLTYASTYITNLHNLQINTMVKVNTQFRLAAGYPSKSDNGQ